MSFFRQRWNVTVAAAVLAGFAHFASPAIGATAYNDQQRLSEQTITNFKANPGQILQQFPSGGGAMISQLRDLLASDSSTLQAILGLLPNANQEQKSALGAALAQAARLYARNDQTFAQQIQQAVAETKDADLILAYAAASGDAPIAAGPGAGSAGSSGGPVGALGGAGGGNGAIEGIGGNGVPTGQFSYTGSAGAAGTVPLSSALQ